MDLITQYRIFRPGELVTTPQYDQRALPPLTPAQTIIPRALNLGGCVECEFTKEAQEHLDTGARVLLELPNLVTVEGAYRLYTRWLVEAVDISLRARPAPISVEEPVHVQ